MAGKRILIVAASIGTGHMQAAVAIRDSIRKSEPFAEITIVDFLDRNYSWEFLVKETYLNMLARVPRAYNFLYRYTQEPNYGVNVKSLFALTVKRKMKKRLDRYRPECVVFTHPIPCCALTKLCYNGYGAIHMAAVITDFAFHRLWLHAEIDSYFVANKEIRDALCLNGVKRSKIFITGIPIADRFSQLIGTIPVSTQKTSKAPQILVMGGGLGLGSVEDTVDSLNQVEQALTITVLTGKNKELYDKLVLRKLRQQHTLQVLGYTEQVHELMSGATLLITKPGGMTCSEALAMQLPLLLINPLPGQEEDNARYLSAKGVALSVDKDSLAKTLSALLTAPQQLQLMKERALEISHPYAAEQIADILAEKTENGKEVFYAM